MDMLQMGSGMEVRLYNTMYKLQKRWKGSKHWEG
jgi:hypothetical protein